MFEVFTKILKLQVKYSGITRQLIRQKVSRNENTLKIPDWMKREQI